MSKVYFSITGLNCDLKGDFWAQISLDGKVLDRLQIKEHRLNSVHVKPKSVLAVEIQRQYKNFNQEILVQSIGICQI